MRLAPPQRLASHHGGGGNAKGADGEGFLPPGAFSVGLRQEQHKEGSPLSLLTAFTASSPRVGAKSGSIRACASLPVRSFDSACASLRMTAQERARCGWAFQNDAASLKAVIPSAAEGSYRPALTRFSLCERIDSLKSSSFPFRSRPQAEWRGMMLTVRRNSSAYSQVQGGEPWRIFWAGAPPFSLEEKMGGCVHLSAAATFVWEGNTHF